MTNAKQCAGALVLALMMSSAMVGHADARGRHHAVKHHAAKPQPESRVLRLLEKLSDENAEIRRELAALNKQLRPDAAQASREEPPPASSNPLLVNPPMPMPDPNAAPTLKGYEHAIAKSAKLKDLTPRLADKVAEILSACAGVHVISGYRKGARVIGSGRPSLHSRWPSEAADLAGNYSCIYSHLKGWPGGYSIDPGAVHHVHVSLSSDHRERGARFVHYGHGGTRYARRHSTHTRYARAYRHRHYAAASPIFITAAHTGNY